MNPDAFASAIKALVESTVAFQVAEVTREPQRNAMSGRAALRGAPGPRKETRPC